MAIDTIDAIEAIDAIDAIENCSSLSQEENPKKRRKRTREGCASRMKKGAATYSPALHCSTIGASGLNFSVRDGKRWDPAAITTRYGGHVARSEKERNQDCK